MQVNKTSSVSFSSYRYPIKSFDVKTDRGVLNFREVNYIHLPKESFYKKLATFFLDNFANTSSHPFWEKCRIPTIDYDVYNDYINYDVKTYKNALKNKKTTILLAKDKDKNIVAALFSTPLNLNKTIRDSKTLYIDSIAVSPKYRGNNVGSIMLQKLFESSKKEFTDAFLVSYKESVAFYKKLGFSPLNWNNYNHQFLISEMAKERLDYPFYADFLSKKLNDIEPIPWYLRIQRRNIPKD